MNDRPSGRILAVLTCCGLAALAGCFRPAEPVDPDAPVVFDLVERGRHAVPEASWTRLDLGAPLARPFLVGGWRDENEERQDGDTFVRAKDDRAIVRLPRLEKTPSSIVIRAYPYSRWWIRQSMTPSINGHDLGTAVLDRTEEFREFAFDVPAEAWRPGVNVLELDFRYASTSRRKAAMIDWIELVGAEAAAEPAKATSAEGSFVQPAESRWSWPLTLPRRGELRAASDGGLVSIEVDGNVEPLGRAEPGGTSWPLAAWGGRRARLHVEADGPEAVTWDRLEVTGRVEPRDANLLLLTIDTVRADHVGAYGYPKPTTPALDRLAAKGTTFLRAYAQTNQSVPSHATILTGRYPPSHGLAVNGRELGPQQLTLPELLAGEAFETVAYVNFPLLARSTMTGKGFDKKVVILGTPHRPDLDYFGKNVFAHGWRWIDHSRDDRFFAWIHSQFLHMEYVPEPWASMFLPEGWKPGADGYEFGKMSESEIRTVMGRYSKNEIDLTPESLEAFVAFYDGALRMSDDALGEVLDGLERLGIDRHTAIVVVSDHGTTLGEHHGLTHLGRPYDHQLHVPMVFYLPGVDQVPGHRYDGLVETTDIVPTLLEYFGHRVPGRVQGRSLLDVVRGGDPPGKEHVFAVVGSRKDRWLSVRSDRWQYIRREGRPPSLFDFGPDGAGEVNVIDRHPEALAELQEALGVWIRNTPIVADAAPREIPDDIREILEKAGYLDVEA